MTLRQPQFVERRFTVYWAGHVAGLLVDRSSRPYRTGLTLVPVDQPDQALKGSRSYWAYPRENGSFEIEHVPPGKYLLVAGLDAAETFYYSGTRVRAWASVITIGEEERRVVLRFEVDRR